MKPQVILLCCAALAVLFVGNHERPGKAAAQVPGEAPSFLTDYVDAVRVGDWFLACVEATAPEERFQSATRNTTAPWVLLDEQGDVLAEDLYWRPKDDPWPLQARPFEGFEAGVDVAVLRVDQKYGLIDRAGKVVVKPVYDNLFGFKPGETACLAEKDGRWGCIDAAGNVIVPLLYDESFARLTDGRAVVTRDGREGLLGEDGAELLPAVYDVVWLEEGAPFGMARAGDTCALFERDGRILFERTLGENGWIFCNGDAEPPFACYNSVDETYIYLNLDGTLFAVTRADNDNPNVRLLLDWLQSDQGRRLAVKTGFTALVRGNQG